MTPASRPDATPFAPGSGELPPPLGPALNDSAAHLLLIVAPDTDELSVRTAVALADARAEAGQRTVLADAGFADPQLNRSLDLPNLEGLADIFEFGASLDRVMMRPDGRQFDFVPTGAYAPEPARILRSHRWDRIVEEVAAESAALLVFVPYDTPGLGALSRRADGVIVLGDAMAADRAAEALDPACDVRAVVEPTAVADPGRAAPPPGPGSVPDASALFDDPELTEPVVFRSDRRRRQLVPTLLILLLLAVLGAAGWFAYRELSAAPSPASELAGPVPEVAEPEPEPEPEPAPVETPLGYSVAVEAHQDLDAARNRLLRLRQAERDIQFYLAPVSVSGSLFYRVLAGPVTDRDAGLTLMERLVDGGHKTAFDSWAVRPTAYAFDLGRFDTRTTADERVRTLAERDIPAYVIPVRYEPTGVRFQVYGGAFENPARAVVMGEMLAEAGIDASLVERVGQAIEVDT